MSDESTDSKPKNLGGRPPKEIDVEKVLASPQGQAAVAAAAEAAATKAVEALMSRLNVARAEAGTASSGDADVESMRRLAMSIAELTDQGSNRKRVAPEVMAKREEARARMTEKIIRYQAAHAVLEYRVIAKTYLCERVVEPYTTHPKTREIVPTVIEWLGVPNEAMEPINDPARDVFSDYMVAIGGMTTLTPKADRRDFNVTPSGLVIKGQLNNRRQVGALQDSTEPSRAEPGAMVSQAGEALRVRGNDDPRSPEVRVLGTVAPPARRNEFNPSDGLRVI